MNKPIEQNATSGAVKTNDQGKCCNSPTSAKPEIKPDSKQMAQDSAHNTTPKAAINDPSKPSPAKAL